MLSVGRSGENPAGIDSIPGGKSTKSQIVDILSREWPLSCRKLYNRLLREKGRDLTYQAVHKAVLQMLADGVLVKKGMDYSLSLEWINRIGSFSKDVAAAYLSGERSVPKLQSDVTQHSFECGYDAILFLIQNFADGKFVPIDSKRIKIVGKVEHMWNPFVLVPRDFGKLKGLAGKVEATVISRGGTPLDKMISKFYGLLGVRVFLGAEVSETPEIIVIGDTVIQIYNPPEMRAALEAAYSRAKSFLSPQLLKTFSDISYGRHDVTILVNRNPLAAETIRGELLSKANRQARALSGKK